MGHASGSGHPTLGPSHAGGGGGDTPSNPWVQVTNGLVASQDLPLPMVFPADGENFIVEGEIRVPLIPGGVVYTLIPNGVTTDQFGVLQYAGPGFLDAEATDVGVLLGRNQDDIGQLHFEVKCQQIVGQWRIFYIRAFQIVEHEDGEIVGCLNVLGSIRWKVPTRVTGIVLHASAVGGLGPGTVVRGRPLL